MSSPSVSTPQRRPGSGSKVAPLNSPVRPPPTGAAATGAKTVLESSHKASPKDWYSERAGAAPASTPLSDRVNVAAAANKKKESTSRSSAVIGERREREAAVLSATTAAAAKELAVISGTTPGTRPIWIRIILPVPYSATIDSWFQEYYPTILRPNIKLDFGYLDPAAPLGNITSDYANSVQIPYVTKACQKAELDGVDGVLIDIAFDTGMDINKHVLDIPCVGALQSAIGVVQSVTGNKFSILSISPNEVPVDYRIAKEYQFLDKLASVHPINVPVLDLQKDFDRLVSNAYTEAVRAIATDGADTIVLGCTGMVGLAAKLQSMLGDKIPVLDGCAIGLYNLEDLIRLNLRQSKQWFDAPDQLIPLTPEEAAKYPVVPLKNPPTNVNVKSSHGSLGQHAVFDALPAANSHLNTPSWNPATGAATIKPSHKSTIPVKQVLTVQDMQDILSGATFYGSGGGGKVATSQTIFKASIPSTATINLVSVDQLSDSDYGIVPCDIGEPSQPIDLHGLPYNAGTDAVNLAMASTKDQPKLTFISNVETGCISFVVPMVSAFQLGLPLLDGDGGGRAVPQMEQLTYADQTPVGPLGLSNTDPDASFRCALNTNTVSNAESLIRPILGNPLIEGNLAMACWGGTGAAYKKFIVRDTISRSLEWGKTIRGITNNAPARLQAVLDLSGGTILYSGFCSSYSNTASGGFDFGSGAFSSSVGGESLFYVQNKNENMAAFDSRYTHPVCLAPDLISYYSYDEGIPLSNAELQDYAYVLNIDPNSPPTGPGPKANQRIIVIASPANPAMWARPDIVASFQAVMRSNFSYFGPMLPYQQLAKMNSAANK